MKVDISTLLDFSDFAVRWQRARLSAVRPFVRADLSEFVGEVELLVEVHLDQRAGLLRKVFENSRKLGESAKWFYGVECEAQDMSDLCLASEIPCFSGAWSKSSEGVTVVGPGCSHGSGLGSFLCEYYKEAAYGLTVGFCDDVRYVRHECVRTGGSQCKDLFLDPGAEQLLFAPIPDSILVNLREIEELANAQSLEIVFPGQIEGEIYFQWKSNGPQSCEDLSGVVRTIIDSYVSLKELDLTFRDVTPRAILSPGKPDQKEDSQFVHIKPRKMEQRWNQIVS